MTRNTKAATPDFELVGQPGPGQVRIRFAGRFGGRDVTWDATVIALDAYPRRHRHSPQYLDIGPAHGARVPITIGLHVAILDTPTLTKTVVMIRNYKRLREGRHEFVVPRRAAETTETVAPQAIMLISGGQTGVDRAALDAALEFKIPCGGFCPRGRRAEDGPLDPRYPLQETDTTDYRERTRRNVETSDGTLILAHGALTGGTALTYRLAREFNKPCLVVDLARTTTTDAVCRWLTRNGVKRLNVAGPRESTKPGIHARSLDFLRRLLRACETSPAR